MTKFNKHTSFITSIDWSLDSKYLRSVCGAYELLFFNMETQEYDPDGASNTTDKEWLDNQAKFGWRVEGIYPPFTDGSHINSVAISNS